MRALCLACCSGRRWATASVAQCCWATLARPHSSAAIRAYSSKASSSKSKENSTNQLELPQPLPELFELQQRDAPLFPELLTPGTRAVLLGIDPDIHGALALLSWHNPPAISSMVATSSCGHTRSSSESSSPWPALADLQLAVHDMPVELWEQSLRAKKHPSAASITSLLRKELQGGSCSASISGLGQADAAVAGRQQPTVVRAVVEYSPPLHMSGKHAWCGMTPGDALLVCA